MSGLRPLKTKVILAQIKEKNETKSGIILQGDVDLRSKKFLVLEVGKDVEYVKKDDQVLIEVGKARDFKIDTMSCLIIDEMDIVAVLDKE